MMTQSRDLGLSDANFCRQVAELEVRNKSSSRYQGCRKQMLSSLASNDISLKEDRS